MKNIEATSKWTVEAKGTVRFCHMIFLKLMIDLFVQFLNVTSLENTILIKTLRASTKIISKQKFNIQSALMFHVQKCTQHKFMPDCTKLNIVKCSDQNWFAIQKCIYEPLKLTMKRIILCG